MEVALSRARHSALPGAPGHIAVIGITGKKGRNSPRNQVKIYDCLNIKMIIHHL
jgi:hypothetical protein